MVNRILGVTTVVAVLIAATGCGKPGVDGLRESFAQQLSSNRFVQDFQKKADDLVFSGPGADGGVTASWRIHIDSAVVEPNSDPGKPYKGTVNSSWYANDRAVLPSARDSNLPLELTDTGLAQVCWAFWDQNARKWSWE